MQKRVYICNLAGTTGTSDLEILFSTIGNVEEARIVSGLGIVDMSTALLMVVPPQLDALVQKSYQFPGGK